MTLVEQTFTLNLKVMRIFGLYPPTKYKTLYKIYAYIVYIFLILPLPVLSALNLLLGDDVDLAVVAQNAFTVFETGCFIFKFFPFVRHPDRITESLFKMENSIFLSHGNQFQQEIIGECISVCTRNTNFFTFFCFLTTAVWIFLPLFGEEYKLPLDVWLPVDITSGGISYVISYIFIAFGAMTNGLSTGVVDPLIGGLVYYATAQVKVLKHNLQYIYKYVQKEIKGNEQSDIKEIKTYDRIIFCVKHYYTISKFIGTFENLYTSMVFTQFLASVLVICISCLQLSMVEPFTADFFFMIIFICTVLTEIYFYCYYGTTLFEESNTLINAAYMGEWLDYDLKSKKALIILMERFKRPIIVTAGKTLDLSLVTFTTILRRAYSLLAVLRNY